MGNTFSLCEGKSGRPAINDNAKKPNTCSTQSQEGGLDNLQNNFRTIIVSDEMVILCKLRFHSQKVDKLEAKLRDMKQILQKSEVHTIKHVTSSPESSETVNIKYMALIEKLESSLLILKKEVKNTIELIASEPNILRQINETIHMYEECLDIIQEDIVVVKRAYDSEILNIGGVHAKDSMNSVRSLVHDLNLQKRNKNHELESNDFLDGSLNGSGTQCCNSPKILLKAIDDEFFMQSQMSSTINTITEILSSPKNLVFTPKVKIFRTKSAKNILYEEEH